MVTIKFFAQAAWEFELIIDYRVGEPLDPTWDSSKCDRGRCEGRIHHSRSGSRLPTQAMTCSA